MTKTVLITGCSSGFGEAAARLFAARGWNVVATMRDPTGSSLADTPGVLVTRLDVEDPTSIAAAIDAGITRFGHLDALINNAGHGLMTIFEGASREAIAQQFTVNVFGVMDVTRAILPHFRSRRAGTIVNVSSGVGVFGAPMASIYTASKFALEGFSEALSHELASLGIVVKIVEPGGAPGTRFIARSGEAGSGASVPADYQPFMEATGRMYAGMADASDPDAVTRVIEAYYTAVTDGTDRLRYVPTTDIRPLVDARRSAGEDAYQSLVRSLFRPKA